VRGDQVVHQGPDLVEVPFHRRMLLLICISAARWSGSAPMRIG
jgi:hypothetical protein